MNKWQKLYTTTLFIFLFFLLISSLGKIYGEANLEREGISPQTIQTAYQFPSPGILPDHPLYKLKVLRDKIIKRLIINPVKKVEYDLLMANKLIYSSYLLAEKENISLAKETALKGENYFTLLVLDYKKAYEKNSKISQELDEKIKKASKKHREIFNIILEKTGKEKEKTFENLIYFSNVNEKELANFKKKNKIE